jgi:hypothetical protein
VRRNTGRITSSFWLTYKLDAAHASNAAGHEHQFSDGVIAPLYGCIGSTSDVQGCKFSLDPMDTFGLIEARQMSPSLYRLGVQPLLGEAPLHGIEKSVAGYNSGCPKGNCQKVVQMDTGQCKPLSGSPFSVWMGDFNSL